MATVILQVDEHPELPDGVPEALDREGYKVLQTADPEETIGLIEQRRPALVLMEIEFDGCNGPHLLEGIRALGGAAAAMPVLVVTRAPRSSALHGEAIAAGASDFLTKPVLARQLLGLIHELAPLPPAVEEPEPPEEPPPPWLSGDLSSTPLPEVLARLHRRGATGVLVASRGKGRLGVQFRNGSPVAVQSNRRRARYRADFDASPQEIEAAIAARAEAELFEGFRWTDGSYRFNDRGRLKQESSLEITRDPAGLLLAGVLECAPVEQVLDRLCKLAPLYVSESSATLEDFEFTPAQERLLAELRGQATLATIIEADVFSDRLLYGLWVAGQLELDTAPTLMLIEELAEDLGEVPPELEVVDTPPPDGPPLDRPLSVDDPEDLDHALRALMQRVMAVDDFEVLDLPLYAPDAQVRAAYERILAEIPEKALHSPDPTIRERAGRIRERIEAAYEHLKDPENRRAYALLQKEKEQDGKTKASAARALEAEGWFRKGERFLKAKRYDKASEAFGMASHLDPEQGEYLSHVGYVLFLSNPRNSVIQREAMEHIANGIKRSPDREFSYVYLGRILRARGETDSARKVFQRAIRIRPDCHAAQQEIRLLKLRQGKGKGILSRLRRR
jgi:CheY-like chemotaxis protein/tetratricopeptide (TPR) repeat protein